MKLESFEKKNIANHIELPGRHWCTKNHDHETDERDCQCCRCGDVFRHEENKIGKCSIPYRVYSDQNIEKQISKLLDNDLVDEEELKKLLPKIGIREEKPPPPPKEKKPKKEKKKKFEEPKPVEPPPPPPDWEEPETKKELTVIDECFQGQKTLEGTDLRFTRKDFSAREYSKFMSKKKKEEKKKERKDLEQYFGFIPMSILPFDPNDKSKPLDAFIEDRMAKGTYADHSSKADTVVKEMEKYKNQFQGLSQYKNKVADFIIKMWGEQGGVFLEPFAGRMPLMLVANHNGMHAVGYEIWKECYLDNTDKMNVRINGINTIDPDNFSVAINDGKAFESIYHGLAFCLYRQDSRYMTNLEDNSIDLVATSPPFWKTEQYGNEAEQLGMDCTYEEFLDNLRGVVKELYRVLKPGSYCVWDINNFRHGGKYYNYYADCYNLFTDIGFEYQDEALYKTGNMSAIFATQNTRQHRVAKIHIYLQVYKKPED